VPDSIPVSINGNDGDDRIKDAYDSSAGRVLTGGGGNDEIGSYAGNDTLDGGDGNDHVEGGLGNDTVTGGPGQDTIYGDATAARCTYYSCKISFGNDVINARDGEADNIDCGIGQDTKKVASGKGKASKAGTATVTLKPSRSVARKLKKLKSAKVTIKLTASSGGAKQTASRTLTLKR